MSGRTSDGVTFPAYKQGAVHKVSEESVALMHGFHQLGHLEPVTPSPEQVAQHARAVEIAAEVEANPYLFIDGHDGYLKVEPLVTERWVADETHEEWMERWRQHRAANPDERPAASPLEQMITAAMAKGVLSFAPYESGR